MRKTYITTMPDHVGAFLQASRCIDALGINITRVSYNKAVDTHTLFIEVEGTAGQLDEVGKKLNEIGYLQRDDEGKSIVLLEFQLRDEPGSVLKILELINEFRFNISYMSSQENGSPYQYFKIGLFVDTRSSLQEFITRAENICRVRVIDYNHTEKNFDNTLFYRSYAASLAKCMDIDDEGREELLIHVNLAMQVLDEQGLAPYRTFDTIGRFAELLARYRKEAFLPRITTHRITEQTYIILIEPPCGSNTAIIKSGEEYLFVDTGYACYQEEMLSLLRSLIPNFDTMTRRALITHADVDHCGLLPLFDEVYMSAKSRQSIAAEYAGEDGFREKNPLHKPYIRICKTLTALKPMNPEKARVICGTEEELSTPLAWVGQFSFGDLHFDIFEGKGGHLPGEIMLADYEHKLAFTGDVYVNFRGMTKEQHAYNQCAPILMTSVDTDPALCKKQREMFFQRLGVGEWQIFGAHGMKKDYNVLLEKEK